MKKLLLTALLISICGIQASSEDPFANVHTTGGATGSLGQLTKQYDWYRAMRKDLGSSRRIGQPHWLPAYAGPIAGTIAGAGLAGLGALGLSELVAQAVGRQQHYNHTTDQWEYLNRFRLPWYISGPVAGAGVYGLYRLAALAGRAIKRRMRHNNLERFVAVWPAHRKQASDEMRDLMKRIYASYSTTGSLGLSHAQEEDLYKLLAYTMAHREVDLAGKIKQMKKDKKEHTKALKKKRAAHDKKRKEVLKREKKKAEEQKRKVKKKK